MMRNREQKKRIKECLSQLKYLDSVYAAEIKKPDAEQDTDLLEECLETMSYLHDVVESLSRQTQIQRSGVGSRIVLRRVAIVAIALAVLLIGMSVAEAAGFRVWSALIHWDSRYLHVTYTTGDDISNPNMGDSIKSNSDESLSAEIVDGHEIICNSIEDAIELLGSHIMLPQNLPDEMAVQEIIYHEYATDPSQNKLHHSSTQITHNGRIMGCILDLCGLMRNGGKCSKIGVFLDI